MKAGVVVIIGRPNVGKSTLINNIIGQKVVITSPKPQTTRMPIEAVYDEPRGQIIFTDTPGFFMHSDDILSKKVNLSSRDAVPQADVVLYIIDHTRERRREENQVLGMVRNIKAPKILVINKIDVRRPSFLEQYAFMEEEFTKIIKLSALRRTDLNLLIDAIFDLLPEREKLVDITNRPTPLLNMDSKTFIAEIIREKIYLQMNDEVPYRTTVIIDEITERDEKTTYIKARILTTDDRYKKMLIGRGGKQIKELGIMARKELEAATGKKIYLDLTVETNPHWQETF